MARKREERRESRQDVAQLESDLDQWTTTAQDGPEVVAATRSQYAVIEDGSLRRLPTL